MLAAVLWTASLTSAGPRVALTFDDGPRPEFLSRALDILDRYQARATFFEIGKSVREHGKWSRECARRGHEIGNHSYSHAYLPRCSGASLRSEIGETNALIKRYAGVTPHWLRPPFGAANAGVRGVISELGMGLAMWSVDPLDWRPGATAARTTKRVLSHLKPNAVILLHEVPATLEALPAILAGIQQQGYEIVSFGQLMQTRERTPVLAGRAVGLWFHAGSSLPVRGGRASGWSGGREMRFKLRVPRGLEGTLRVELAGGRTGAQRVVVEDRYLGSFRGSRRVLTPLSASQTNDGLVTVRVVAEGGAKVRVTAIRLDNTSGR